MTIVQSALQRMAVYTEPAGSFAVDHTSTTADFLDVCFIEMTASLALNHAQLEPMCVQQYLSAKEKSVLGVKGATLSFQMILAPTGIAANASTSSPDHDDSAQLRIFKAVMGGLRGNIEGSAVATATSSSAFVVTGTEGSQFTAGGSVGLLRGTNSQLDVREIKTVSTDTVTLKQALANATVIADVVYQGTTAYLTDNPNTSLQFVVEGAEPDDRWALYGGQCTGMQFEFPINDFPKVTFTIEFANWLSLSSQAITNASYLNDVPTYVFGEYLAQVTGTSTRQIIDVQQMSFAPQIVFAKITSPSGTNGITQWQITRAVPVCTVQFTQMYQDLTWFTARDARSDYHLQMQIGNTAGGTVTVVVPTAQISDVQRVDNGGFAGQQITATARMDSNATDQTTEIRRSGLRIHWV